MIAAGNHDVAENFPGPAEVDDDGAFRNDKGNRNISFSWRLEGIYFADRFALIRTLDRFGRGRGNKNCDGNQQRQYN